MRLHTRYSVVVVTLLVTSATLIAHMQAQVPLQPKSTAGALSAEEQAFRDALALKDPDAKLRAFQKLLQVWPHSPAVKNGAADFNILQLTTTMTAQAAKEARRAAEAFAATIPSDDRDRAAWQNMLLAMAFARTDVMWPEAERYSHRALAYWDSGGTNEAPKGNGLALERAVPLTVLGQSIAKQGRDADAEPYLREAYERRADEPGVVGQVVPLLLDIARRRGRSNEQQQYLIALALHGQLTPELRTELEEAYRRTHPGSQVGLEAALDRAYEAELPKAIPVEAFTRTPAEGRRTVLTEMFTGASCGPCLGMNFAIEAAMRRYELRDSAVLVYHLHSPAPDPLVSPSGKARAKAYGVNGAPHVFVDGVVLDDEGGGKASEAAAIFRSRLQPAVDGALGNAPAARISLKAAQKDDVIRASVVVDQVPSDVPGLRLHVALAEDRVRYSGGNGIRFHPMVVRKMAGDGQGLAISGKSLRTQVVFDVASVRRELQAYLEDFEKRGDEHFGPSAFKEKSYDIDPSRLVVVAFVEEARSHRVLQAAVMRAAGRQ